MEDWAEIRRLRRSERLPIKAIARVMGISKNTVKKGAGLGRGRRGTSGPGKGSIVDAVEPRIGEFLQTYPRMPATVIAERIGWTRSIRVLRDRVAELRPGYLPPDPASPTSYVAGVIAQCDLWFPPITLPVGFGQDRTPTQLPVLTMVTGYAPWLLALLIPTRKAEDLFAGWWRLIERLGAVPRVLVWDGEGAIGRWRGGRSELTAECQAFRGTLGTKVLICLPAAPEAKGLIERAHDYLERSFLPGRTFASPTEFNTQLADWLDVVNTRPGRALGCAPGRSDHRRPPRHARPAAGGAGDRMARLHAVGARSLHPLGQQRLQPAPEPEVEVRCLDDYDIALGITHAITDNYEGGVA